MSATTYMQHNRHNRSCLQLQNIVQPRATPQNQPTATPQKNETPLPSTCARFRAAVSKIQNCKQFGLLLEYKVHGQCTTFRHLHIQLYISSAALLSATIAVLHCHLQLRLATVTQHPWKLADTAWSSCHLSHLSPNPSSRVLKTWP